jgi:hypothetical protein
VQVGASVLTAVHYFAAVAGKRSGCESHEDRGLLTLIWSEGPGLQVGLGLCDADLVGGRWDAGGLRAL